MYDYIIYLIFSWTHFLNNFSSYHSGRLSAFTFTKLESISSLQFKSNWKCSSTVAGWTDNN